MKNDVGAKMDKDDFIEQALSRCSSFHSSHGNQTGKESELAQSAIKHKGGTTTDKDDLTKQACTYCRNQADLSMGAAN